MAYTTTNHSMSYTPEDEKSRWRTPQHIFDLMSNKFGPYDIDGAADETNHLCTYWMGSGSNLGIPDALTAAWKFSGSIPPRIWTNPPYARGMVQAFMYKAHNAYTLFGVQTTLLIPVSTDQPWWHQLVWNNLDNAPRENVLVHFFHGRIRFIRPDNTLAGSPTFASVAVHFGGVAP